MEATRQPSALRDGALYASHADVLMQKCTMISLTTPERAGDPVDCASLHYYFTARSTLDQQFLDHDLSVIMIPSWTDLILFCCY